MSLTDFFIPKAEAEYHKKPAKAAKEKDIRTPVIKGIDKQLGYLDGAAPEGKRKITWYDIKDNEAKVSVRYGSRPIEIATKDGIAKEGIIPADKIKAFYAAVKKAVQAGELDDAIKAVAFRTPKEEAPKKRGRKPKA
ncbi:MULTISPECIES: hypothetical protein [unclassified Sphingopyxis]|uniref:hypothetical protein n=1 Tax=unclassified Sphingopyxis TaxID=2614943 RepID=UPI000731B296|nr:MULTISPECIES: hypothetical protein [unclassified Sphingopyxis]KTE19895.1 hypothetical protein ATE61_20235 [Sphingopyxis sp. H057]KTE48882.1 hypothetical protein ATE64_20185 [Sphingopyxis sp. H073]KTE55331.1 hypothetical protein ATE66_19770 [Sphingopyxis sp. H107]KTE60212.1 hypothetical protein ATE65_19545 [Sphingopyxis sp. H100]KTE70998.1 hypothetical protein ATE60_14375 [Sphingopyxis sp. H081]